MGKPTLIAQANASVMTTTVTGLETITSSMDVSGASALLALEDDDSGARSVLTAIAPNLSVASQRNNAFNFYGTAAKDTVAVVDAHAEKEKIVSLAGAASQDDVFNFQGTVQMLGEILVNPYNGFEVEIKGNWNVSTGSYLGGEGFDILFMTANNDYLNIVDANGNQIIEGVEQIQCSVGNDIVILAHATIQYGDVQIFGQSGHDIIWSNNGDDEIQGGSGNDIIHGGGGNDYISGASDNDLIFGGEGNDIIYGGNHDDTLHGDAGNDVLYGESGNDVLSGGAGVDLLDGGDGDDVFYMHGDFVWSTSFVAWNVGSPDSIINGERVRINPRFGTNDVFIGGDGHDTLILGDGGMAVFLDDIYSASPIDPHAARIQGIEEIIGGNGNDIIDLTSRVHSYGDVILHGGDGGDVLWASAGNDVIYGGNGNDNIDGGTGNDRLIGGAGNDKIFGRGGADVFVFDGESYANGLDTIGDFNALDGDMLDISDILQGYDPFSSLLSDFVRVTQNGNNATLLVNADGSGNDFVAVAVLQGVTTTLEDLQYALILQGGGVSGA